MHNTLIQMTLLMVLGASWRWIMPNQLHADQVRLVLTTTIYHFFLPAMVLAVLWQADLGKQSFQFAVLGCSSISVGILLSAGLAKLLRFRSRQTGALILAAAFPNVTYLGLPVLEQTFGALARPVVLQLDLFAAAPMVFSIGIAIARHYGEDQTGQPAQSWLAGFNTPPFWAALLAVLFNQLQLPLPVWLLGLLEKMSAAVAPLMIFSLGLALSWRGLPWRNVAYLVPIALIKLVLLPLWALRMVGWIDLDMSLRAASVMDIAMPSMVLGIVFCDRYKLDSALYAAAVTVTTALSLFSLPFWYGQL